MKKLVLFLLFLPGALGCFLGLHAGVVITPDAVRVCTGANDPATFRFKTLNIVDLEFSSSKTYYAEAIKLSGKVTIKSGKKLILNYSESLTIDDETEIVCEEGAEFITNYVKE